MSQHHGDQGERCHRHGSHGFSAALARQEPDGKARQNEEDQVSSSRFRQQAVVVRRIGENGMALLDPRGLAVVVRSIQIGPQADCDTPQRRMLVLKSVAVRGEPLHAASDLRRLIVRLGEETPGGGDSNRANQDYRQRDGCPDAAVPLPGTSLRIRRRRQ
jgi:hypothetical protein